MNQPCSIIRYMYFCSVIANNNYAVQLGRAACGALSRLTVSVFVSQQLERELELHGELWKEAYNLL